MKKNKQHTMNLSTPIVLLTVAAFFISMAGKAQTDSLGYAAEYHHDSLVEYLTPIEYAFMFHEETKWLLKSNLLINSDYGSVSNLKLSLEKKIVKGFSLNAVLFNYTGFNLGINPFGTDDYGIELSLESRWYYKHQKYIRKNKPTANLSGSYLALGAGYRKAFTSWTSATEHTNLEFIPLFAKWGIQRRFLKRGFVDVGLMAGWNKSLSGDSWSTLFFNTYVDAGLAFTRDRQKLDFDKLCPVLRCHAADRFLLKTNLVNIINLAYVRESMIGSIAPNISAEFKIGTSPFSINTKLGSKFQYSRMLNHDFNTYAMSPQLTIEGRYYYSLHRRMLMGKSGNGLSANYISLGATYRGQYYTHNSDGNNYREGSSFVGLKVGTGIQRLISEHLYLDLNIGFGYGIAYNYTGNPRIYSNKGKAIFDLGFGIGYRF